MEEMDNGGEREGWGETTVHGLYEALGCEV